MKKIVKHKNSLLKWRYLDLLSLVILFIISLFLRSYLISYNLFFGPEQGRDMLVVRDIVFYHKLTLIGPTTAISGVFHGPLYYYIAAIPFYFNKGNPLSIEYFFLFLNALTVFLIYILGKEMFNRRVGLISSIIFTFSFGAVEMARWLSHPPLIIPLSCLFFICLSRFLKGKNVYLILSAIAYGLSSQTEFTYFMIFSFISIIVFILFFNNFKNQKIWYLFLSFLIAVILALGNFVLFDFRHKFLMFHSLTGLIGGHSGFYGSFLQSVIHSINNYIILFFHTIIPFHFWVGLLLFILGIVVVFIASDKNKIGKRLLLIWLLSPFVVFVLLKYYPLVHYFLPSLVGIIVLMSFLIDKLFIRNKTFGLLGVFVIVCINFYVWFNYLPQNANVYFQTTQPDLKYSDQTLVIKEIYKEANGKPFSFQAYTIPYWLQEEWQYLFWYVGTTKYGYVPTVNNQPMLFVIIQRDNGDKRFQMNWLRKTVSKWGKKENVFTYGALTVERLKTK